jgi:GTP-binding protein HflX
MGYDPQRALLVGVVLPNIQDLDHDESLEELEELAVNLGYKVQKTLLVKVRKPQARFLTGPGKAQEIIDLAKSLKCGSILFDVPLLPSQQRNWESTSELNVIDRQEVILDIFADRAQTKEAVLQVELARLQYELPRMKRLWTHLDRQRGGGAVQRGEGEAQIEIDQRLIRKRIARVKDELKQVVKRRGIQRKQRMKVPVPSFAIVGYTNAGKSTLLNCLTGSDVLTADKLFATLDPTSRRLTLPSGRIIVGTDTVGFVNRLPHRLIQAFKATLEEALVAEFFVHVLDSSNPAVETHLKTTLEVLEELGVEEKPRITVFNKTDLVQDPVRLRQLGKVVPGALSVSCKTGEGIDGLLSRIDEALTESPVLSELVVPYEHYELIAQLHELGCIQEEKNLDNGIRILARDIPAAYQERLNAFMRQSLGSPGIASSPVHVSPK